MSTQIKILVGLLFTIATVVVLIILGVDEDARMARAAGVFQGRKIEKGAEAFQTYCSTCHGDRGEGIAGKGPAINRKDLLATKNNPYLKQIAWNGTLHDFLMDVVSAGRPQRSKYYALAGFVNPMPTWSQDYGGPLRPDQVDSVVAYVENWAGDFEQTEVVIPPDQAVAPGPSPTPRPTVAGCDSKATAGYGCVKPPFPVSDAVLAAGKTTFEKNCMSCHGEKGAGDGPAGLALSPKPRNFTDCTAMNNFGMDQHFASINEGKSNGLMPAWKAKLSEQQIWEVLYYERSFCKLFEPTIQK